MHTAFPAPIPPPDKLRIHRIVVALGAKDRCRQELGGSGSLVLSPSLVGVEHTNRTAANYSPFHVGLPDDKKGFVHVFDDVTLDVIVRELDTITDLTRYLRKKESFVGAGKLKIAIGEENLLAAYLSDMNVAGEHDFVMPKRCKQMFVEDGVWFRYVNGDSYKRKKDADRVSYLWDHIIEEFGSHAINGTLVEGSAATMEQNEALLRILALEPRLHRRSLAAAILERAKNSPVNKISARRILSYDAKQTLYLFLFVPDMAEAGWNQTKYREFRRGYLEKYCFVTASHHRDHKRVVGLATEAGTGRERSYDLMVCQIDHWTAEMEAEAASLKSKLDIMKPVPARKIHHDEYPNAQGSSPKGCGKKSTTKAAKMRRNGACPCGSGAKYKRCCGRRK